MVSRPGIQAARSRAPAPDLGPSFVRLAELLARQRNMLRANYSAEGVCYTMLRWRRLTALNVVAAGGRLFGQASIIRDMDRLASIELLRGSRDQLRLSSLIWRLDPPVVDAVRIACCFENLFKARLLLSGYIVHEVDRKTAPDLGKEQAKRPVLIRSVKRREGVPGRRDIDFSFNLLRAHNPRVASAH